MCSVGNHTEILNHQFDLGPSILAWGDPVVQKGVSYFNYNASFARGPAGVPRLAVEPEHGTAVW